MLTQSLEQKKNNYLNFYLEKTLGLQQLHISINNYTEYLFLIENFETYSHQEKILTDKIISSLKLKASQYLILNLTETTANKCLLNSKYQVTFKDDPEDHTGSDAATIISKKYQTYSPRILVLKPELKIKVWNLLKKIIS